MKQRAMELEREANEDVKSSSECSSGCQSGWTSYFGRSHDNRAISTVSDDEDLSMVSDASSGPPHHLNDDNNNNNDHCRYCRHGCCFCSASSSLPGKKRRVESQQHGRNNPKQEPHSSLLDDTASSPLQTSLNPTTGSNEDVPDLSCGFSATQLTEKSALRKHMGYFKSCDPTNPASVSREEGEKKPW